MTEKNHDSNSRKIDRDSIPPSSSSPAADAGVNTSSKQSMGYVTVNGITQRTNIPQQDFPIFCLKELLDNAADFLDNHYRSSEDTRIITVSIKREDDLLRIAVRNSNERNIIPFPNLKAVFDYDRFYSTKRNQHRISRGALGDALKEILAMGYALVNNIDRGDSFIDKQWEEPLILRFNGKEYKIYILVNKANEKISTRIDEPPQQIDSSHYIEVEVALPILGQESDLIYRLEQYCKKYTLFRNKIEFHFGWDDGEKERINDRLG